MSFTIEQYGIKLKRIESSDIELIRKWRNSDEIRKTMAYQKRISESQQKKWFESINNQLNYYFLISIDNKDIGVINCKEVNLTEEYGEGGIFIWDENHKKTPTPLFASLILLDYIFNILEIGDKSYIRILKSNKAALNYNKFLGYSEIPGQSKKKHCWFILTKSSFNKKAVNLRNAARNYSNSNNQLKVSGKVSDINLNKVNDSLNQTFLT